MSFAINIGILDSQTIRLPLKGRAAMVLQLQDINGDPVDLTEVTLAAYVLDDASEDIADALIGLTGTSGLSILNADTAQVLVDCSAEVSLLSAQRLYWFFIRVTDTASGQVTYEAGYPLLCLNDYINSLTPVILAGGIVYSTLYVNTPALAGPVGGSGYLDGVDTTGQPLGCVVTFSPAGGPPQEWQLVAFTSQSGNGYLKPLNFDGVTNNKIWQRLS